MTLFKTNEISALKHEVSELQAGSRAHNNALVDVLERLRELEIFEARAFKQFTLQLEVNDALMDDIVMTNPNDSAFPLDGHHSDNMNGLTKLEFISIKFMAAQINLEGMEGINKQFVAQCAIECAKELIAELAKEK